MGIGDFFHKIGMGFVRMGETSIPYTSEAKKYGNNGEDGFVNYIKSRLPDCRIKQNVVIQTLDGNAEIDCLILYKNKLFAIEIKRWKGKVIERNDGFIQYKKDRWTDETHAKYHKSPFRQLARAIYLLRKQIPINAWVNSIVCFEDAEYISVNNENVWFSDVSDLATYIIENGKTSYGNNATLFFDEAIPADYLCSNLWDKSLHCVICDDFLKMRIYNKSLTRNDIAYITIEHHWSYDNLHIRTYDGVYYNVKLENGHINVIENGYSRMYALCKLDYIELGRR